MICSYLRIAIISDQWTIWINKTKYVIIFHLLDNSIDELYEMAIRSGATGGKLLGAGGGGFVIFYVPPEKQVEFLKQMKDVMNVPFHFENIGTSIIYSMEDEIYW